MTLPVAEVWTRVLPAPGVYAGVSRAAAVLLSALLAYRVAGREYEDSKLFFGSPDEAPPGGLGHVLAGVAGTLVYVFVLDVTWAGWEQLARAVLYAAVFVLTSFGFVQLAKQVYVLARYRAAHPSLEEEVYKRARAEGGLPVEGAQARGTEVSFVVFAARVLGALTAVVTGFAALNELVGILPKIVEHATLSAALAVIVTTVLVGEDYARTFLNPREDLGKKLLELKKKMQGHNAVEAGLAPAAVGIGCILGYLALDVHLGGQPSRLVGWELVAIALKISMFAAIAFALWRVGVREVIATNEKEKERMMGEAIELAAARRGAANAKPRPTPASNTVPPNRPDRVNV